MRPFNRTLLVSTFALVSAAATALGACGTDSASTATGDDGGTVDTEGGAPTEAGPAPPCTSATDCASGVCDRAAGSCAPPSCSDGVKNADETDIDCGGACAKCDVEKRCALATDCTSNVCADTGAGMKCQAPSSTDHVKNGTETGVDCGGTANPLCGDGEGCLARADCESDVCKAGVCAEATPDDGAKNGAETDIDCGGPDAKSCADGLACLVATDCASDVCKDLADGMGLRCQAPTYTDTVKNGAETDVDCGGDPAHACAAGKICKVANDCSSLGCSYDFTCAPARSCTRHYGGDTCGTGGAGGAPGAPQAWESCCKTIPVTTASGGTVYMDKYPTTAGRMRAFLESVGYDVRGAVQTLRAANKIPKIPVTAATSTTPVIDGVHPVLDAAWDPYLPVSFAGNANADELADCSQSGTCTNVNGECGPSKTCLPGTTQPGIYTSVRNHLGGQIFKNNAQSATGCFVGSPGTHSFRFPDGAGMQDGAPPEQPVEVYDTKSLNCVDYLVAQAFCVWDGGRLETFQEWQAAYGAGATPFVAQTTTRPVEPNQRCDATGNTGACTVATSATACKTSTTGLKCDPTSLKCCLPTGDKTYWGCRFPWATDANHPACGLSWPATTSIEWADYKYSYEYPKLGGVDYIVHLTAPGRLPGRGPLGHSDVIGTGFELTSSVTTAASPLDARHRWSGNGSWEVHNYNKNYTGATELLNKYGKLGLRCVKLAPN